MPSSTARIAVKELSRGMTGTYAAISLKSGEGVVIQHIEHDAHTALRKSINPSCAPKRTVGNVRAQSRPTKRHLGGMPKRQASG